MNQANANIQLIRVEFSEEEINQAFESFQRRMAEYSTFEKRGRTIYPHDNEEDEDEYDEEQLSGDQDQYWQQLYKKIGINDQMIQESLEQRKKEKAMQEQFLSERKQKESIIDQHLQIIQNGARKSCPILHIAPNSNQLILQKQIQVNEHETIIKKQFLSDLIQFQKPCAKKSTL